MVSRPHPSASEVIRHAGAIQIRLLILLLLSESTRYFFDNPVNPDFGLLYPDSDPDRHQNLITWSLGHTLPLQEISSKSVHNSWARTRAAQLSAGYTVNTYSKPPLYDAFIHAAAAAENQRVGKTRRQSIYIADRHDLPPTNQSAKVTVTYLIYIVQT